MTNAVKIDGNDTELTLALETSPGVVDGSTIWNPEEPNSYKDFGPQYKSVTRAPINASHQRRKGSTVDLDVAGGWQSDLTYANLARYIEGVFFASYRRKAEKTPTAVDATNGYAVSAVTGFHAGDLVLGSGFTSAGNNGLKKLSAASGGNLTFSGAVAEASPPAAARVVNVGHEFGSADLAVDSSGALPKLVTTSFDLTTLGLVIGEPIFIGGDSAGTKFATASNNGMARVRSIAAHAIELDKAQGTLVTDAGTGKTVRIFYGRVIKNETAASGLITARTYQAERKLGRDASDAANDQAEYLVNSILNELMLTFNTADKVTYELGLLAGTYETVDSATGPKTGTRPTLAEAGAYNTSSHVKFVDMALVSSTSSPLYAFLTDISFTIKNNAKVNKAVGVLGGFSVTRGLFEVSAAATAYFANVAAANAVKNNSDVTIWTMLARDNAGLVIDLPLISLGDARNKVAANEPITLSLGIDAATAINIDPNMDYTALVSYFDYLPALAM